MNMQKALKEAGLNIYPDFDGDKVVRVAEINTLSISIEDNVFDDITAEQQRMMENDKFGGNIVQEEFHRGAIFGIRLAKQILANTDGIIKIGRNEDENKVVG